MPSLTDALQNWSRPELTDFISTSPTGRRSMFPYTSSFLGERMDVNRPSHDDKAAKLDKRRVIGFDPGNTEDTSLSVFELDQSQLKALYVQEIDYSAIELRIMAHMMAGTCTSSDEKPSTVTLEAMIEMVKKASSEVEARKQTVLGWSRHGPIIRVEGLMANGACTSQLHYFEACFRHMVIITPELIEEYGVLFDAQWLMEKLVELGRLSRGRMYEVLAPFPPEDWKKRPHEDCRAIWRGLLWVLWAENSWRDMIYGPAIWRGHQGPGVVSTDVC